MMVLEKERYRERKKNTECERKTDRLSTKKYKTEKERRAQKQTREVSEKKKGTRRKQRLDCN